MCDWMCNSRQRLRQWCEDGSSLTQSIHQPTDRTRFTRRDGSSVYLTDWPNTAVTPAKQPMNADCSGSRRRAGNGSWLRTWYGGAINTVTWSICLADASNCISVVISVILVIIISCWRWCGALPGNDHCGHAAGYRLRVFISAMARRQRVKS